MRRRLLRRCRVAMGIKELRPREAAFGAGRRQLYFDRTALSRKCTVYDNIKKAIVYVFNS